MQWRFYLSIFCFSFYGDDSLPSRGCQLRRQGASLCVKLRYSRGLLPCRRGESEPRDDTKQQHSREISTRATSRGVCVCRSLIKPFRLAGIREGGGIFVE